MVGRLIFLLFSFIVLTLQQQQQLASLGCESQIDVVFLLDRSGNNGATTTNLNNFLETKKFVQNVGRAIIEGNPYARLGVIGWGACSAASTIAPLNTYSTSLWDTFFSTSLSTSNGDANCRAISASLAAAATQLSIGASCPGFGLVTGRPQAIVIVGEGWYTDSVNATLSYVEDNLWNKGIKVHTVSVANHTLLNQLSGPIDDVKTSTQYGDWFRARRSTELWRLVGPVTNLLKGKDYSTGSGYGCSFIGSSHFYTFDGRSYDFQGVGDYWIFRNSGSSSPNINVQARLSPCQNQGSRGISCVEKIAVAWDSLKYVISYDWNTDKLTIVFNDEYEICNTYSGEWCLGPEGSPNVLDSDYKTTKIRWVGNWFEFTQIGDTATTLVGKFQKDSFGWFYLSVDPRYHLDAQYTGTSTSFSGYTQGLCGLLDGCAKNDLWDRSGISRTDSDTYNFGESWKVLSSETNLFGDSYAVSYVYIPRTDFPSGNISTEASNCLGLHGGRIRQICEYDVLATTNNNANVLTLLTQYSDFICIDYCANWGRFYTQVGTSPNYCPERCRGRNNLNDYMVTQTTSLIEEHKWSLPKEWMHFQSLKVLPPYNLWKTGSGILDGDNNFQHRVAEFQPLLVGGNYTFQFDAWNMCNVTTTKYASYFIRCDQTPVVYADGRVANPPAKTIQWNQTQTFTEIMMNGTADYDDSDQIAYSWAFISITRNPSTLVLPEPVLNGRETLNPTWTPNSVGSYTLELAAYDGCSIGRSQITINVVCAGNCWPKQIIATGTTSANIHNIVYSGYTGAAQYPSLTLVGSQAYPMIETNWDFSVTVQNYLNGTGQSIVAIPAKNLVGSTVKEYYATTYIVDKNFDCTNVSNSIAGGTTSCGQSGVINVSNTAWVGRPLTRSGNGITRQDGSNVWEGYLSDFYCNGARYNEVTRINWEAIVARREINVQYCKIILTQSTAKTSTGSGPVTVTWNTILTNSTAADRAGMIAAGAHWYPHLWNCEGRYTIKMDTSHVCFTNNDAVTVDVRCGPRPVAKTSCPQTAAPFEPVELEHCDSFDPLGRPFVLRWELVSAPANSAFKPQIFPDFIYTASSRIFVPDVPGSYLWRLHITNYCSTSSDDYVLTVSCAENNRVIAAPYTSRVGYFATRIATNGDVTVPIGESIPDFEFRNGTAISGGLPYWGSWISAAWYLQSNWSFTQEPLSTVPNYFPLSYRRVPTTTDTSDPYNYTLYVPGTYRFAYQAWDACTSDSNSVTFRIVCAAQTAFSYATNLVDTWNTAGGYTMDFTTLSNFRYSLSTTVTFNNGVTTVNEGVTLFSNSLLTSGTAFRNTNFRFDCTFNNGNTANYAGGSWRIREAGTAIVRASGGISSGGACNGASLAGVPLRQNYIIEFSAPARSTYEAINFGNVALGPDTFIAQQRSSLIIFKLKTEPNSNYNRIYKWLPDYWVSAASASSLTFCPGNGGQEGCYAGVYSGTISQLTNCGWNDISWQLTKSCPNTITAGYSMSVSVIQGSLNFDYTDRQPIIFRATESNFFNALQSRKIKWRVNSAPMNSTYYVHNTTAGNNTLLFYYDNEPSSNYNWVTGVPAFSGNDTTFGVWPDVCGTYTLEAYVTDGCQNWASVTQTITVTCGYITPRIFVTPSASVTYNDNRARFGLVKLTSTSNPVGINQPFLYPTGQYLVGQTRANVIFPKTTAEWWVVSAPKNSIFSVVSNQTTGSSSVNTIWPNWFTTQNTWNNTATPLTSTVQLLPGLGYEYINTNRTDKFIYPWLENHFEICFRPDVAGSYTIRLKLTTTCNSQYIDQVITASCPTLNAPAIRFENTAGTQITSATLDGYTQQRITIRATSATTSNGLPLQLKWFFTAPTNSSAVLADYSSCDSSFVIDRAGTYQATLQVCDGCTCRNSTTSLTVACNQINSLGLTPTISGVNVLDWDRHWNVSQFRKWLDLSISGGCGWSDINFISWQPPTVMPVTIANPWDPDPVYSPTLAPTPVPPTPVPSPVVVPTPVCCCPGSTQPINVTVHNNIQVKNN